MKITRLGFLATAAAAALAATPAAAQVTEQGEGGQAGTEASPEQQAAAANQGAEGLDAPADEEVIVTARRRAESLQDVPIAVTAYSGAVLERQGALDITEISDTTPNVTLETSRGTNTTLTAYSELAQCLREEQPRALQRSLRVRDHL